MKRRVDMNEISDGRLYSLTDTVKCDSGDCAGCSHCCRVTADTIILDPYDIFNLNIGTGKCTEELLSEGFIELSAVDGIVLFHMAVRDEKTGCMFLDKSGRCSIHDYRPGLCRLFPLGRFYEENGFKYFLQVHECVKGELKETKVFKWLGIKNIKEYEKFVFDWHELVTRLQEAGPDTGVSKKLLEIFFFTPYTGNYFFGQYEERRLQFEDYLKKG